MKMIVEVSHSIPTSLQNYLSLFSFLKVSIYPLSSRHIKTNGLGTLSRYPIKYFPLFFISFNFEITISSTSTSQSFFLYNKILILILLCKKSQKLLYYRKMLSTIF